MVTKFSEIWVVDPGFEIQDPRSRIRDPGSEIQDPKKIYPGSRGHKAPDPGCFGMVVVVSLILRIV
jgi:hypothetical protein